MPKSNLIQTIEIYKNASQLLATTFFRYLYEDESIEPSDISFVGNGTDTAECWGMYFSTNNMYDILYHWYAPKLVKDWYDYMMVADEYFTIRYFKHLVDTHWYTTPEQLLEDYKNELEENEKRINSPEYKEKIDEVLRKATQKFISDNF